MKKITIFLITALIITILGSVIYSATAAYVKITPQEAKRIMDSGKPYILVDVRTDSEYKENHIQGAVLIPDYSIAGNAESALPDKNEVILVYCRSGGRSANAAKILIDLGYTNVFDFGGILSWPYETISL